LSADPSLGTDPAVKKKLFVVLASWKHQFQGDPKMKLVASLYDQCKLAKRRAADPIPLVMEAAAIDAEKRRRQKEARERESKRKEEERETRIRETRRPKRRAFDFEREKPEVLASIVNASQASSNLVNAIMVSRVSCLCVAELR
jgi:LAS seventeen-binding protein 5